MTAAKLDVIEPDTTSSMTKGRTPVFRLGDEVRVRMGHFMGWATITALDVVSDGMSEKHLLVRDSLGRIHRAAYCEVTFA